MPCVLSKASTFKDTRPDLAQSWRLGHDGLIGPRYLASVKSLQR
jgi:hypothetical protein